MEAQADFLPQDILRRRASLALSKSSSSIREPEEGVMASAVDFPLILVHETLSMTPESNHDVSSGVRDVEAWAERVGGSRHDDFFSPVESGFPWHRAEREIVVIRRRSSVSSGDRLVRDECKESLKERPAREIFSLLP